MIIKQLTSETNSKYATIELSYDEIKCINNSFCKLLSLQKENSNISINFDSGFKKVKRNFTMLFSLVKHGNIPPFECGLMHSIDEEINNAITIKSEVKDNA